MTSTSAGAFDAYVGYTRYTLPLTTTFTPSAECSAPTYTLAPEGNDTVLDGMIMAVRGFKPECWPSDGAMETNVILSNRAGSDTVYSPGVCFEGYETKASSVSGELTWATCCPGSMELMATGNCSQVVTTTLTIINRTETEAYTGTFFQKASSMVVGWQSSDLSVLSPSATSRASLSITPAPTSASPLAEPAQKDLNVGAKAGIGVGISLGTLLSAGIIAFMFWKRHKRKKEQQHQQPEVPDSAWIDKPELPGESKVRAELGTDEAIYEVPGAAKPHEVDAGVVVELEGDVGGWEVPVVRSPGEVRDMKGILPSIGEESRRDG